MQPALLTPSNAFELFPNAGRVGFRANLTAESETAILDMIHSILRMLACSSSPDIMYI